MMLSLRRLLASCDCPGRSRSLYRGYSRNFSIANRRAESQRDDRNHPVDIRSMLAEPTWSVASLLPPKDTASDSPEITSKQLHHLLRLSALPPPASSAEEEKMLATLSSQLHFVKEIGSVDTTGVEPLHTLRDETKQGEKAAELGIDALADALVQEEVKGVHLKRIRRKKSLDAKKLEEDKWDVLGTAEKRVGNFFVVEGVKAG